MAKKRKIKRQVNERKCWIIDSESWDARGKAKENIGLLVGNLVKNQTQRERENYSWDELFFLTAASCGIRKLFHKHWEAHKERSEHLRQRERGRETRK